MDVKILLQQMHNVKRLWVDLNNAYESLANWQSDDT